MAACDDILSKPQELVGRLAIREATAEVTIAEAEHSGFRYGGSSLWQTQTLQAITCIVNQLTFPGNYRVGQKNTALHFCPYLCQLLIDFQNSFTVTVKLCRQFATMRLLHIPPHRKCISTLPCETSM